VLRRRKFATLAPRKTDMAALFKRTALSAKLRAAGSTKGYWRPTALYDCAQRAD
jgi:hypothetical protein